MRPFLAGALLLLFPAVLLAQDDAPPIRRTLGNLTLGQTFQEVQQLYAPAKDWASSIEKRTGVRRFRLERTDAKSFPEHVQILWLSFKNGRLVEIQLVYDRAFTRKRAAENLAVDLAIVYGEPHRSSGKFWWSDDRTVLRVFDEMISASPGKTQAVELRTAIQVLEAEIFRRAQ